MIFIIWLVLYALKFWLPISWTPCIYCSWKIQIIKWFYIGNSTAEIINLFAAAFEIKPFNYLNFFTNRKNSHFINNFSSLTVTTVTITDYLPHSYLLFYISISVLHTERKCTLLIWYTLYICSYCKFVFARGLLVIHEGLFRSDKGL